MFEEDLKKDHDETQSVADVNLSALAGLCSGMSQESSTPTSAAAPGT